MRRENSINKIALTIILLLSVLLSSCQRTTPSSVQTTSSPSQAQTTPPPLPRSTGYQLAGKWSGDVINSAYKMDAIIEFEDTCAIGEVSGINRSIT